MNNYENIFRWMKKATKTERHIEELELFAKKHPIIFMKFHKYSRDIVERNEDDEKYIKAKNELEKLFNQHSSDFSSVFEAVKSKFNY